MKICFISYEYEPFPGGGIATYHNAAARILAAAGHEVHVVTNRAWHGRSEPHLTQRLWTSGNLTVHRLRYFDEKREPPPDAQFFDVNTQDYAGRERLWARDPSNLAAHQAAGYVEALHAEVGLDVIEAPEFFAEAFYVLRRRKCGDRALFPPVCVHGHISSRIAFGVNHHAWELGWGPHRHMMLREEYCVTHADALITPSRALMQRYEALHQGRLPQVRAVIPYYLDLPEDVGVLPDGLEDGAPYLALLGRVEPRKGPDIAMRAFALLAERYPTLKLVLMGKELWHFGESVDDVIAGIVPARHRGRIVRLGQVPRDRALAAARGAAAFLHPAPWDNYPCAVLEAMAVGATCVVSDAGGQAEMIEDGRSGLVFESGNAEALASAVRRVLDDPALKANLSSQAVRRVREITDPKKLTEQKLAVFRAMVEREESAKQDPLGPYRKPAFLRFDGLPALPGRGLVVLDAAGAAPASVATTHDTLWQEVRSSAATWRLCALLDPRQEAELPAPWTKRTTLEPAAWTELDPDDVVVYAAAGVRLDLGMLAPLVAQVVASPQPCGSFAWLRPASARVFPYPSDFSGEDVLVAGQALPPIFAVRARHLARCTGFWSLRRADQRLCALLAAAAAAGELWFQHVGQVCGDFYGDLPLVTEDNQLRAIGYLEILGLMPARRTVFGSVAVPVAPTAEQEAAAAATAPAAPTPAVAPLSNGHDAARIAELEAVYREHMALKQHKVVRWLRKAGAFDLARKVFPKSKKMIGPG
jgi:glycosyltransferase involved in cell wall biosynthesis